MKQLIVFLVRRRLGLKKHEVFTFAGQKSNALYYFTEDDVMKMYNGTTEPSSVSLHWLLNCDSDIVSQHIFVIKD